VLKTCDRIIVEPSDQVTAEYTQLCRFITTAQLKLDENSVVDIR